MKIEICEPCYRTQGGKLVQSTTYSTVTHYKNLRMDFCSDCFKAKPKTLSEYIKFVGKVRGVELTEEEVAKVMAGK